MVKEDIDNDMNKFLFVWNVINQHDQGHLQVAGLHISTFRGYRILFSIRNRYINRFTNHFSIHS
jgi:hypothetical protein